MSKKAVDNHAKKYSKAYRGDLDEGKKKSKWTTDFEAMALKTVIKLLLSKWGILSVDMQRAIQDDQKTFDEEGEATYGDNQPDAIEAENVFELPGPDNGQQKDEQPESAEGMAETGTDAADEGGYVDPDEVDAFMESMGLEELPFK